MALRDPVAAYNAANNIEALFVRDRLIDAGVEAFVIEDVSQIGAWVGGLVPEIHKPQVFVERADLDRAKPVVDEFEQGVARHRSGMPQGNAAPPIDVLCDECGTRTSFSADLKGTVQQCPRCHAYLDVGDEELEGWDDLDEAEGDVDEE